MISAAMGEEQLSAQYPGWVAAVEQDHDWEAVVERKIYVPPRMAEVL